MSDLTADLARLAAHLPCLDRAAADLTAPVEVRAVVAAMAAMARSALATAAQAEVVR
ncbi:hypothetical protein ACFYY8_31285 [Streptosporangium sp. NPDC001559]|uniref:hypothetical protein n=1 Tax=Streptosporangium sp. NPDC001559 TaxID=3366187 RepID=UPI0036E56955